MKEVVEHLYYVVMTDNGSVEEAWEPDRNILLKYRELWPDE